MQIKWFMIKKCILKCILSSVISKCSVLSILSTCSSLVYRISQIWHLNSHSIFSMVLHLIFLHASICVFTWRFLIVIIFTSIFKARKTCLFPLVYIIFQMHVCENVECVSHVMLRQFFTFLGNSMWKTLLSPCEIFTWFLLERVMLSTGLWGLMVNCCLYKRQGKDFE